MRTNVTFKSNDLKIAGHLYLPDDYKKGEKRPAIVVSHPFGGVKEQTAGLYAKKLSEKGFITLAFDASYQGESESEHICYEVIICPMVMLWLNLRNEIVIHQEFEMQKYWRIVWIPCYNAPIICS